MLKAYDYSEQEIKGDSIRNMRLFEEEKALAKSYVLAHPAEGAAECCPVCGSRKLSLFFEKWGAGYQICAECHSIFMDVEPVILGDYLKLEALNSLRRSEFYQSEAEKRRASIWEEQIMWMKFRMFRYLGRNKGLNVIDYGNRHSGLITRIRESGICGSYELRGSILKMETDQVEQADVLLYLNQLQHEKDPADQLRRLRSSLKDDGILILNTRTGSGFDILTLKNKVNNIYPYEHIMLPSTRGLEIILGKAGYELLEITTPGTMDMEYVLERKDRIDESNFFIRYLVETADRETLADFQRFLQKSGLSSFSQLIARKKRSVPEWGE